MYGSVKEPEMIPTRSKGRYDPITYKGEWVRYDIRSRPFGGSGGKRWRGIGQVKTAWVYDSLIVEIHSTTHGEISAFLYEDSKYRRDTIDTQDRLWRIEMPVVLKEGIGL